MTPNKIQCKNQLIEETFENFYEDIKVNKQEWLPFFQKLIENNFKARQKKNQF